MPKGTEAGGRAVATAAVVDPVVETPAKKKTEILADVISALEEAAAEAIVSEATATEAEAEEEDAAAPTT